MIWNGDNRANPRVLSKPLQATVALIYKHTTQVEGDFLVLKDTKLRERTDFCETVRFLEEPAVAECTGVLVARDVVATAGHCTTNAPASAFFFVFGFNSLERQSFLRIPLSDVYEAKEQVFQEYRNSATNDGRHSDWSLVKLDRPVAGREPVDVRRGGRTTSQHFYVIGHPLGLPAKTTKRASGLWRTEESMMVTNEPDAFFRARLDIFTGNSGSPVFDAETDMLEGLLVGGDGDWVRTGGSGRVGGCVRESRCPVDSGVLGLERKIIRCRGERVVRTTEFVGALEKEERRQKIEESPHVTRVDVEAVGGRAQFPVQVADLGSASVLFPSFHTPSGASASLSRSNDSVPESLAVTSATPTASIPHQETLNATSPPPLSPSHSLLGVSVRVSAEHEFTTCYLAASLHSPLSVSVFLGPVCASPFNVDAGALPWAVAFAEQRNIVQSENSTIEEKEGETEAQQQARRSLRSGGLLPPEDLQDFPSVLPSTSEEEEEEEEAHSLSLSHSPSSLWTLDVRDMVPDEGLRDEGRLLSVSVSFLIAPTDSAVGQMLVQTLSGVVPTPSSDDHGREEIVDTPSVHQESAPQSVQFSFRREEGPEVPRHDTHLTLLDWALTLVLSVPSPPSEQPAVRGLVQEGTWPLSLVLESPGQQGRQYRFRVMAPVPVPGSDEDAPSDSVSVDANGRQQIMRIQVGGMQNERHRMFFYGVDPEGLWSVRLLSPERRGRGGGEKLGQEEIAVESFQIEEASLTLMTAQRII
uniref:Serine protease n=2 Tax=Chromera velia CCMP2878 TaxID=1169474 RepID=A0A0K6S708_9ALVE|eukprot:Cvel_18230.t2-p1 / transcript=Cvel_18230.t2 / gene=Cvel_18230 / organism=Chromera_velia_CCMP2878 / gene_product=hypothetical protein / transcript_product=hypothetical protein / location=Cvel_scaffold1498:26699-29669(-) / protein_length=754 / sequence_SO=supercontig / SO=protein_coding / is_pseudo=false